jgi:broad specificity phosphatase PhoE
MADTAELIAQAISAPVVLMPGLSEHARRSAAYGTKADFEKSIRRLFDEPEKLVYGDESANATYDRFSASLDGVLRAHENKTVIAVSGGTAISLFISRRSRTEAFPLWQSLRMPTAFVIGRDDWKVREILYP